MTKKKCSCSKRKALLIAEMESYAGSPVAGTTIICAYCGEVTGAFDYNAKGKLIVRDLTEAEVVSHYEMMEKVNKFASQKSL